MLINRKKAPAFRQVDSVELIRPEVHEFRNGLKAYVISAGEQELVRIEFIFENTGWDRIRPLNAAAVNAMLTEGTRKMTSAEIAGFVDYYGAFMHAEYSNDHSAFVLFTLNKHVDTLLPVIVDLLFGSIFPEEELMTYKRNYKQKLLVGLRKNDIVARRELNRLLFGDSAYGYRIQPEDYENVVREDLLSYFERVYTPANLTLIVSGKVTAGVLGSLNHWLGGIASGPAATKADLLLPCPDKPGQHLFEQPGAIQSAIRMGKRAVGREHPDFPALQVLMTIFGGYFGSRLMTNIREDKGYTYGIGAGLVSLRQSGYFYIASEVGSEVCAAAISEIGKEINILRKEPVPAGELGLVRNYMMGSFLGDLENAFSHADKFKNIHFYGLDYSYYDTYVETIKTVGAEQLMELANTYLDFDSFERVVVGKM
jgi:predicted Zn-dependent peptidase